jgi:hypothetical protein
MQPSPLRAWLYANWFYAGLTASLFLFAMTPLLWNSWSRTLFLVFIQLPVYMIHQVEEHHHDRFRRDLNERLAGGRDALTREAVLIINLGGVWAVDLTALYLAWFVHPGLGLITVYLALVNSIVHVAAAVFFRAYNPGLVSAFFLLLPAGEAGWWVLVRDGQCTLFDQALGLAVAITIHAMIVLFFHHRIGRLRQYEQARPN